MLKVASYCRVSTDKEDQANSFESQRRYFKEYIDRQPDRGGTVGGPPRGIGASNRASLKKKADVLDAFFSRQITKDEMRLVNERYDRELEELRGKLAAARSKEGITYETEELKRDVRERVTALLNGETNSEAFYKNVLDYMVVYRDRRVEVCLNLLPQKWIFILENPREINRKLAENVPGGGSVCNNDPSVPPPGIGSKFQVRKPR